MQTPDIVDAEGRLLAFEVSNVIVSRRGVVRLIAGIPGVHIVKKLRLLSPPEDEFCEFQYGSAHFAVSEPFGDSSRYHIGPKPLAPVPELARLRTIFEKSRAWRFLF